jgi:hypothetical protein
MSANRIALALVFLLSACQTPRSGGMEATIEKYGSKLSLCGLTGRGVCEARVFSLNNAVQPISASVITLPNGIQSVAVLCRYAQGGAPLGVASDFSNYYLNVKPGMRYQIVAEYTSTGGCRTGIIDTATGQSATVSANGT